MRSRASLNSHPIHPALIPFPFAFLIGAALFDIAYLISGRSAFTVTASHLNVAGIAAGLLAAVPGIIDYHYTVPPQSSGKKRATQHALGNSSALLIFGLAWFARSGDGHATLATIGLEVVGALLMSYASSLGGTLVVRNMVSVDHRYAGAGKWQEETVEGTAGQQVVVAKMSDLEDGQMKLLRLNGGRVALAKTADGFCAFQDHCTHRGASLAGGVLIGNTVQCLWHGSQFDVTTGRVACGPASEKIRIYETATKNGNVLLTIPADDLDDRPWG